MEKDVVLVTGGAGYIGSVVVKKLVELGEKVRVLDKGYFGFDSLKPYGNRIETIQGDVRNISGNNTTYFYFTDVKSVIHLGSLSNDPTADFDRKATREINFEGTMRVAECAKKAKVNQFSFASSCAVYGFNVKDVVDEESPTNPQSAYAESKLEAEKGICSLASPNFNPISFRQGTVYGISPRMRYDLVVNTMTKDACLFPHNIRVFDGDCFRPLISVDDVATAHIEYALRDPHFFIREDDNRCVNLVYNNYSIGEIAKEVAESILLNFGIKCNIIELQGKEHRSYQVQSKRKDKLFAGARFTDKSVFYSVSEMANSILSLLKNIRITGNFNDDTIYHNLKHMQYLIDAEKQIKMLGGVL